MRNCSRFSGVLHPHLFRLVTDAFPWKPAAGEKKKSLGTVWNWKDVGFESQPVTCVK